jgi:hypothetical protein
MRPLPLGRQLTYPSSPVQRIEYDRQDSAAPQRRRAPHQRLCRATGLCGGDPAGGRCPGGHSGIAAAGAALPTRPRQKRLVLARAHAPTGTREGAALVSREESGVVCGPRRSVDAFHKHLARPSAQRAMERKLFAMKGFHHPGGRQQAFLTGLAHLSNLVPYQRRAQHAEQYGVEVEGGRVLTADWLLHLQIRTSGGLRCAVASSTT